MREYLIYIQSMVNTSIQLFDVISDEIDTG